VTEVIKIYELTQNAFLVTSPKIRAMPGLVQAFLNRPWPSTFKSWAMPCLPNRLVVGPRHDMSPVICVVPAHHAVAVHSAVSTHVPDQEMVQNPQNFRFFQNFRICNKNLDCLHFRVHTISYIHSNSMQLGISI
jgi:hypothetical protein